MMHPHDRSNMDLIEHEWKADKTEFGEGRSKFEIIVI